MVGIHAKIRNTWICVLEIPQDDIERLSLKPLKWLRFVAFATLGAKGHLHHDAEGDHPVTGDQYETVLQVTDLAEGYYFIPEGDYHFVDPDALHDSRSSTTSSRLASFPESIAMRDGNHCVVTGAPPYQAAHIIPPSKGDAYIQSVILRRRQNLYEDQQLDLGIESPENEMLLRSDLRWRFGAGESVFLKTPNFALNPIDIPRVEQGDMPASRTTFQHIVPYDPDNRAPVPPLDVLADWSVDNAPSILILDYAYGVAVSKRWGTREAMDSLRSIHNDTYKRTPTKKRSSSSTRGQLDKGGGNVKPLQSTSVRYQLRNRTVETVDDVESEDREISMDTAFDLVMFFGGLDPGTSLDTIAQRQEEEAEKESQKITREKVQEWLGTSLPPGPSPVAGN